MSDIARVHESKYGTYHTPEGACPAWTVNDTRGYIDEGPDCDECGAENLSFAFVCLDGGEALCEDCAVGVVEIVSCDCE